MSRFGNDVSRGWNSFSSTVGHAFQSGASDIGRAASYLPPVWAFNNVVKPAVQGAPHFFDKVGHAIDVPSKIRAEVGKDTAFVAGELNRFGKGFRQMQVDESEAIAKALANVGGGVGLGVGGALEGSLGGLAGGLAGGTAQIGSGLAAGIQPLILPILLLVGLFILSKKV